MRLIFCNTTGRSGTKWLSYILARELKAVVEHEGSPKMVKFRSGKKAISFKETKKWWKDKKIPSIKRKCKDLPYIDTGHLVNKGFLEPLIDLGIIPDLIILRRESRAVAKSLLKLNTIPFRSKKGKVYCCSEYEKLHLPLPNHQKFSDYQLCYWYCLECQARAVANKKMITEAGGKICEVDFNEIISEDYPANNISRDLEIPKKNMLEKYVYFFRRMTSEKEKNKNRKSVQKRGQKNIEVNYDQEEIEIICSINEMKSDY